MTPAGRSRIGAGYAAVTRKTTTYYAPGDAFAHGATMTIGNLLSGLPDASRGEVFADIVTRPRCRIERIVSHGQTTPRDRPYVQAHDEWVLLLAGAARVLMAEEESELLPGDHLFIPAGAAHRVTFTDPAVPTIWLAVHIGEAATPEGQIGQSAGNEQR